MQDPTHNQKQDMVNENENGELFQAWLKVMDWNKHGGLKQAAQALGKQRQQIERYNKGFPIPKDTRLAMSAIAEDLRPWDEKTGGLAPFHVSLSIG